MTFCVCMHVSEPFALSVLNLSQPNLVGWQHCTMHKVIVNMFGIEFRAVTVTNVQRIFPHQ